MNATPPDVTLKALLDDMTSDLDKYPLDSYPARLIEISQITPHTIVTLESAEPLRRYNCVMHALSLVGQMAEYGEHPAQWAPTAFANHLCATVFEPCDSTPGALVTWSNDGVLRHIGRVTAQDRIESKWGAGILCAHGPDEVPSRYGVVSGYYRQMDVAHTLEYLRKFHKSCAAP